MKEKKILKSAVDSMARIADARCEVSSNLDSKAISRHVEGLTKPKSPSSTMKKAGIALIAAPEPVTGVAGVALLASSFALRKNEPASVAHLARETRDILREIQSLMI